MQNSKWVSTDGGGPQNNSNSINNNNFNLMAIEKQLFQNSSASHSNTNIAPPTAITVDTPTSSSLLPVPVPVLLPSSLSSMPSSSFGTATAATAARVSMNSTNDINLNNNNNNGTSFRPSLPNSSISTSTSMMTPQTQIQTNLNHALSLYTTCSNNHWSQATIVAAPGPYDIVCGRNSGAYKNIGNRRFRVTIEMNLQRYIDSPTREEKTNTIKAIVHMLHDDIGARFLKKELVSVETGTTTTTTTNSCPTMLYGELT